MNGLRKIIFSDEFEDFYTKLDNRSRNKYNYALQIIQTQYVVSQKFVKRLKNTDFYELRISINSDEHRTILFAIDNDSFMESKSIILLNSFLKKDTKQYKAEILKAQAILKRYSED